MKPSEAWQQMPWKLKGEYQNVNGPVRSRMMDDDEWREARRAAKLPQLKERPVPGKRKNEHKPRKPIHKTNLPKSLESARTCRVCGKSFLPNAVNQVYCCEECSAEANRRRKRGAPVGNEAFAEWLAKR